MFLIIYIFSTFVNNDLYKTAQTPLLMIKSSYFDIKQGTLKCFVAPQTLKYAFQKRHFMFIMWVNLILQYFFCQKNNITFFVIFF